MAKKRDYKKEYRDYHSSPAAKKNRAACNKARREALADGTVQKGDNNEIDHIEPLSKGGSNAKSNRRKVSRKTNRKKGNRGK